VDGAGPLLICYDGSDGAGAALETAARFFTDCEAVVACYWQPFAESSKPLAMHILELVQDAESINQREDQLARQVAEEGAALARAAGMTVRAEAVKIDGSVDEAILSHADELDATAIVLGSRSRSNLRSLILGDVANEIAQRATDPVFIVPSSDLSQRRNAERVGQLVASPRDTDEDAS
jgi:nucleotide-binding universal stress UspA family protein